MMSGYRGEVLRMYRKLLKISRTWQASNPENTIKERNYMQDETRRLFKQNKNVTSEDEIVQYLREAQARTDIAVHYRIPYPRPVNLPQNVLPPTKKVKLKSRERNVKLTKPIYIKSYTSKSDT